jgi:hypothetical protein
MGVKGGVFLKSVNTNGILGNKRGFLFTNGMHKGAYYFSNIAGNQVLFNEKRYINELIKDRV